MVMYAGIKKKSWGLFFLRRLFHAHHSSYVTFVRVKNLDFNSSDSPINFDT